MELDDLCTLECLDESEILNCLKERYSNSQIYTKCGMILVSINPYKNIDLYSEEVASLYRDSIKGLQPHIYKLLEQCIQDQSLLGEHTIIINGDSGSGKTECARRILGYLKIPALEHIDSILEGLGNCKTKFNNNSSRFGKLIRLNEGAKIQTFLLEKARVTEQAIDEQNFHVFYYILAKKNRVFANRFINFQNGPENEKFCARYDEFVEAFSHISIDFYIVEKILFGILYLGSIEIKDNKIVENAELDLAIEYLNLNRLEFENYILKITMKIGEDRVVKPLTIEQSYLTLNSLARQLYSSLFNFIVDKINKSLLQVEVPNIKLNILDIFGFENFESNGLDQFCINWCNERIHDHFVRDTFNYQRNILIKEGVKSEKTLKDCIVEKSSLEVIEKRLGLVDLIDEESFLGGNSNNLQLKIQNYTNLNTKTPNTILFKHYNGNVTYSLCDFVDKNREKSTISMKIFNNIYDNDQNINFGQEFISNFIKTNIASKSLVVEFKNSLNALFNLISKTQIKYVKCIKPNFNKEPDSFNEELVLNQLKNSGIFQAINLSQHLFPYMLHFEDFTNYYPFSDLSESYLTKGNTIVFFNYDGFIDLERRKKEYINTLKSHIRSFARVFINRKYHSNVIMSLKPMNNTDNCLEPKSPEIDLSSQIIREETLNCEKLRESELKCCKMLKIIEADVLVDIETVHSLMKMDTVSELADTNSNLKELVDELKEEVKLLQQVQKCEILLLPNTCKTESDVQNSKNSFGCEDFLQMKEKFRKLVFSEEEASEKMTKSDIFSSLIDLFIHHIPNYTGNSYDSDKILCFSQCVFYILSNSTKELIISDFETFLKEFNGKVTKFQNQKSNLMFFISNLIEFKALFKPYLSLLCCDSTDYVIEQLDSTIKNLTKEFIECTKQAIKCFVPYCILDAESLKKNKRQIFNLKKIFSGPSILKLTGQLETIHRICNYYYLSQNYTFSILSNILTDIDQICFNSLLIRKKFLNIEKCYQIKYNLAEIEKFCFNIGCRELYNNLSYVSEALRIASTLARVELFNRETFDSIYEFNERTCILKTINESFLNEQQINSIIILFNYDTISKLPDLSKRPKFLPSRPLNFQILSNRPISQFTEPIYIPFKSLIKILRLIGD